MRIAQVAPLTETVPPLRYGGTERIVPYLTEELVTLGHDVTLFASGDSRKQAELVPIVSQALRLDPRARDPVAPHVQMVQVVMRRAAEFDIIHFHIDHYHPPVCAAAQPPYLTTMHGRLDLQELPRSSAPSQTHRRSRFPPASGGHCPMLPSWRPSTTGYRRTCCGPASSTPVTWPFSAVSALRRD